jgi:hypothetical protein
MKSKNFISATLFKAMFIFMALIFFSDAVFAQVSCGGQTVTGCLKFPSQTYQCIVGDVNAQSLFGGQLLTPTQAQTNPQFLIVTGKITFSEDYTFAAGSDIVFLNNTSGFKVAPNSSVVPTLVLNSSFLHGCTKLWAGVEVAQSAGIIATDCEFEDAKAAIILRDQSFSSITGNTFKKNVCGILGLSSLSTGNISLLISRRGGISGNTFWGDDQLLESAIPNGIDSGIGSGAPGTVTNFPYAGIWIERVAAFTVGSLSDRPSLNAFLNFGQNAEQGIRTQGIRSISSNLTVRNSVFSNFGASPFFNGVGINLAIEADAISAINESLVTNSTTVIGVNNTAPIAPVNTFTNCYFDISTKGTNLTVQDMTSSGSYHSVSVLPGVALQALSYDIKDNQINSFRFRGIAISVNKAAKLNISDNRISDSNDPIDLLSPRYAILLDGFIPGGGGGSVVFKGLGIIKNNEIHAQSNLDELGVFWGIGLRQVSYLIVEGNRIFDDIVPTTLTTFRGIMVGQAPCDGLRLYSNTIVGSTTEYGNGSGISITESANCVLNCNETNNTNDGILFRSMCDNTDLSKNRFNFHGKGLNLDNTGGLITTIGKQSKKENRWLGNDSPIEAFASDNGSVPGSTFEINSSDLNSEYWPSPRKIGTVDDNMQWFKQLQGEEPSNNFTCLRGKIFGEEDLGREDQKLLNNTYTPPAAYPALDWEARWRFADRLHRNPELSLLGSEVSDYYLSTANESYSHLNYVYQSYLNRWDPTVEMEDLTSAYLLAIEQRFALDNLLQDNVDISPAVQVQMLAQDVIIRNKAAVLKFGLTNWADAVDQSMQHLLEEVNSVACSEDYEIDMQTVLGVMIEGHLNANVLTDEQDSAIKKIAAKCRYSGGYAVVLARSFFAQEEIYSQDIDCKIEERGYSVNNSKQTGLMLSPNPATQTLSLMIDKSFSEGVLRVFNSQGTLVHTKILTAPNVILPIGEFPTGVYRLNVSMNGVNSVSKIFIKI